MAYNEALGERVKAILGEKGVPFEEKKMFGGVAFMIAGNMAVGIMKSGGLMVRVVEEKMEDALSRPGAAVMQFTGRPMRGFVVVDEDAVADKRALGRWVDHGVEFARTAPPKKKKPAPKKAKK